MNVIITKNDMEIMKREVMSVFNGKHYLIIVFFALLLIGYIVLNLRRRKIKVYVFLCLIPILISIFLIIKNNRAVNDLFGTYSDFDTMTVNFKIQDGSLVTNNLTRNYQSVIDGKTVKKIIYKKHTIIIYTSDKVYSIPNCMNLDELLQKE